MKAFKLDILKSVYAEKIAYHPALLVLSIRIKETATYCVHKSSIVLQEVKGHFTSPQFINKVCETLSGKRNCDETNLR